MLRVFTIYGHSGHLYHVTWIIYVHIGSPLHIDVSCKNGFIGQAVSKKKIFECHGNKLVYCPGERIDQTLGTKFSIHLPISFKFFPFY